MSLPASHALSFRSGETISLRLVGRDSGKAPLSQRNGGVWSRLGKPFIPDEAPPHLWMKWPFQLRRPGTRATRTAEQ